MKPEHFPFRDGERLVVTTYAGRTHDGTLVAINPDGLMLGTGGSSVVMVPWGNVASAHGVDLGNDRVREIAETFARPERFTLHSALADRADFEDQGR